MLNGKTVLVTGATGLLGYNITHELLDQGVHVIVLGRNSEKIIDCYGDDIENGRVTYFVGDISDIELKFERPVDYIFHAAGSIELNTIINRPLDIIRPNVMGTANCCEFLAQQSALCGVKGRLVFFSSEAVYGPNNYERIVKEEDTTIIDSISSQRTPYSYSKRMGEIVSNAYAKQYGVDSVNIRLSWGYGNSKYKPKQALFDFISLALSSEDIHIRNANSHRRDNISMSDAISAILLVAEKGISGEAYNISSAGDGGNYAAPDEIADIIVNYVNSRGYSDHPIQLVYDSEKTNREPGICMDNQKLKSLGWKISTSICEGIENLVEEIYRNVY